FARRSAGAFEHRFFGKAVRRHELVSVVPLRAHRAGLSRERRNDDVKSAREQCLINHRIARDGVSAKNPWFIGGHFPGDDNRKSSEPPLAGSCFVETVVALDETGATAV